MKGQKILIGLGILIGAGYILLLVLKTSGIFFWYRNPTTANEPAIKQEKLIFASNLKEPSRADFIVFKNRYSDSIEVGGDIEKIKIKSYLSRLCALPGDIIEMKNGVLFVNGQNFDQSLILKAYYRTTVDELNKSDYNFEQLEDNTNTDSTKTIRINLDTKEMLTLKKQIKLERIIKSDTSSAFQWLSPKTNYTSDNFGPIKIPNNCYFVLGDNRHQSADSRFIGFIEKKDCTGVVINQ
ncbi:signal peptidase I [Ferruginibacter sp. SUN002]|uniref:signal peptidase I n=1 Tax=Ferruginibacter sp. SUN002 TaxID=2937789 RepID=UPI003D36F211